MDIFLLIFEHILRVFYFNIFYILVSYHKNKYYKLTQKYKRNTCMAIDVPF